MLEATDHARIQIGKLGVLEVRPGMYYYGGSAKRGIASRVTRHFRITKKVYWHIDYLTVHQDVTLLEAWCFPGQSEVEHIVPTLEQVEVEGIPHKLGAGDCTRGCHSHLVRGVGSLTPDMIALDYYIVQSPAG